MATINGRNRVPRSARISGVAQGGGETMPSAGSARRRGRKRRDSTRADDCGGEASRVVSEVEPGRDFGPRGSHAAAARDEIADFALFSI